MKSKIYITALIVTIILSSIAVTNFKSMASTTANIVVDIKNVVEGKEVAVNINLQNYVDFSAANFSLTYDSSVLKYTSYIVGNSLRKSDGSENGTVVFNNNKSGEIKIAYMSDANQTSETKNAGKLLTLKFNVISGAGKSTSIGLEATTLKRDDGTDVNTNIKKGELRIISGIKMNNSSLTLKTGNTSKLSVSTLPSAIDISNETIAWKSANKSIATVSSDGVVTPVAPGTTEITATVLGLSTKCTITVIAPLQSISLSETSLKLNVGDSKTLKVTYNPTNTTDNKNVTWNSSNKAVAKVDTNGKITAVSSGTAVITATVGSKTAKCTVSVLSQKEEISISLNKKNLTLPSEQIRKLTVTSDKSLEGKDITWNSSNKAVATVNQNGLVTALKEGTTTITVTVEGQTATCKVTVSGQLGDIDNDKSITAFDAYKALEASVNILIGSDVKEQIILTSDVDKDENVTAQDAYKILQYSVNEIDEF